jgi:phage terminase large subunit-like protein
VRLRDFGSAPCWIGIDLASKIDIAALVALFRTDKGFALFGRYFLPETTLELPQNEHYRRWRANGLLTVTDGDIIDYDPIEAALVELSTQHEIRCVAYDPFQATQFSTRMRSQGFPMVEVPMIVKQLSEPMKTLEATIISGEAQHDGDEAMAWMMSNVVAFRDAKENIYPRKEREENKIDGPVALLLALNRMLVEEPQGAPSVSWV